MRTPDEIRGIEFTKTAVGGYKQSEVDSFIDEIAVQVENMALKLRDYDLRNKELEKKVSESEISTSSLQSVLIAAQRVSEEVEREAREKAEKIVAEANARAEEVNTLCEQTFREARNIIESEKAEAKLQSERLIAEATFKAEAMIKAASDSVEREQLLYDKLKLQIVAFRKQVTEQFIEQAEMLKKLPDEVPFDPTHAAKAISFDQNREPDYKAMIDEIEADVKAEQEPQEETPAEEILKTFIFEDEEAETELEDTQLMFDRDND